MKNRCIDNGINVERIILSILLVMMLLVLSGCQAGEQVGEQFERTIDQVTSLPGRFVRAIISLFGGIGEVGEALTRMIRDMIGNMMGE